MTGSGAGIALGDAEIDAILADSRGCTLAAQVLRERPDSRIERVRTASGETIVVKRWARGGVAGLLRRLTRSGTADREWRALRELSEDGASVPRPYFRRRTDPARSHGLTDAIGMEDLGETALAVDHARGLARGSDASAKARFDSGLVEITRALVARRLLDADHGLQNTVVRASGEPVRLDFELARRVPAVAAAPIQFGTMLGRLLATYAIAVQPETAPTREFAALVAAELRPSRHVRRVARRYVDRFLEAQMKATGIETRVELGW